LDAWQSAAKGCGGGEDAVAVRNTSPLALVTHRQTSTNGTAVGEGCGAIARPIDSLRGTVEARKSA